MNLRGLLSKRGDRKEQGGADLSHQRRVGDYLHLTYQREYLAQKEALRDGGASLVCLSQCSRLEGLLSIVMWLPPPHPLTHSLSLRPLDCIFPPLCVGQMENSRESGV